MFEKSISWKLMTLTSNFKGVNEEAEQAANFRQIQGTSQPATPRSLKALARGLIGQGRNVFEEQTEEGNNDNVGRDVAAQGREKGTKQISQEESENKTKEMKREIGLRGLNSRTNAVQPSINIRHKNCCREVKSRLPITRFELVTFRV